MNKRRILAIAMSLCIVAILAVGASLAYFTDTDSKTNTFTVGNVSITLNEMNADGTDFTQNQKLYPGTKTQNNIAKIVTVPTTKAPKMHICGLRFGFRRLWMTATTILLRLPALATICISTMVRML